MRNTFVVLLCLLSLLKASFVVAEDMQAATTQTETAQTETAQTATGRGTTVKTSAYLSLFVFRDGQPLTGYQIKSDTGISLRGNKNGAAVSYVKPGDHRFSIFYQDDKPVDINLTAAEKEHIQFIVTLYGDGSYAHIAKQTSVSEIAPVVSAAQKTQLQGEPGWLQGSIVSSEENKPVANARIYLSGTTLDATTDKQGHFKIKVPAGEYSISVVHPKFSTQTLDNIKIEENDYTQKDIELTPVGLALDDFVVTAPYIKGSVASLVDEKKNLSAVADVLGAEQISRSGDSSAAGALSRVAGLTIVDGKFAYVRGLGDRYSSVQLNGAAMPSPDPSRRAVPLDLFPSSMIQNVLVRKTYTADMPGEFGGGVVQIRTKGLPEEDIYQLSMSAKANTRTTGKDRLTYAGGETDWLGVDDGSRELPGAVSEVTRNGRDSIVEYDPFINPAGLTPAQIEPLTEAFDHKVYDLQTSQALPGLGISYTQGQRFESDLGVFGYYGFAEYKHEESIEEGVINTYSATRTEIVDKDKYQYEKGGADVDVNLMANLSWHMNEDHKVSSNTLLVRNSQSEAAYREGYYAEGDRLIKKTELNWEERQFFMQQLLGEHKLAGLEIDWQANFAQAEREAPDNIEYRYDQDNGEFKLVDSATKRNFSLLEDKQSGLGLDVSYPFELTDKLPVRLKSGFAYSAKERHSSISTFDFRWVGEELAPASITRQTSVEDILVDDNLSGDGYQVSNATSPSDAYDATWDITAFYGMADIDLFSRLKMSAGIRQENSVQKLNTFDANNGEAIGKTLDSTDLMPAFNMTLPLSDSMNIRFAYSETVSRPDLKELSNAEFRDPELGFRMIGNPNLKIANIAALDLKWEWYFTSTDTLSLSWFSKDFTNPIERVIVPGFEAPRSFQNAKSATNSGFEIDFRKTLDFISSNDMEWFVSGNYASITSEVQLAAGTLENSDSRALQGQADYTLNFIGGMDYEPWDAKATLLFNMVGEKIAEVGAQDLPNVIEQPSPQLDFVYKQALFDNMKIGFKWNNILDSRREFLQGGKVARSYKKGTSGSVSLNIKF